MPSDLSSYLATNYLTADAKPAKKRKRKGAARPAEGLLITDDDDSGWTKPADEDDEDAAGGPATVAGTSAEFRRAKKSAWKTVGAPVAAPGKDADTDAADAVLASAAAENAAAGAAADEAPVVEGADGHRAPKPALMSDGTHAGLQSAASLSAQLAARQAEERAELEELNRERRAAARRAKKRGGEDEEEEGEQLVLRDATGRRVDAAMARAEARRAAVSAEDKAEAARRALRGDVQVDEARRRRERLDEAALMPLARGRDDDEMNREMRAQQRWNDPMAQFLDAGTAPGGGGKKAGGGGRAARRPLYKGGAPPNRYGIKPGYRWDGVDRGIGFEAERFKAINRRERNKVLDYSWQMDE